MPVTWNLTKKMKGIKKSDVIFLSIGKSGRTWIRVMINKYISTAYGVPFGVEDLSPLDKRIPSILYTHEMWRHLSAGPREKILGKYLVPDKVLYGKKVIVLYRDPRDVIVSMYFHTIKRSRKRGDGIALTDMIKGRQNMLPHIIAVLNGWRERLNGHPDCLWVSYEDLRKDTLKGFMDIIRHISFDIIDDALAGKAVEFADFENMKKMEAQDHFGSKILRPVDPSDPDSYKTRKGEVGGYLNYFNDEDLNYITGALKGLDPFFGYR